MKRLCVAVLVTMSSMALAQEIGTEITPVTPGSGNTTKPANQPNDNPYANNPPPNNTADKQGEVKPAAKPVSADGVLSAQKGAFGMRGTFGGQVLGASRVGMGATPLEVGTIGLAYWATDSFSLLFDLGFGLGLSGAGANIGFAALIGMDYHFGSTADALRPLFNLQVGVGSTISSDIGSALSLTAQVGGGAAYFFSPRFSLTGRLGLGFRLPFGSGQAVVLTTLTPAVGAAWYF